ncbi:hypothetical protein KCP73_01265 [Salmonella enterica subsp. enterica]|nr:hypothetical protein KCP73_01265 [Salmonella enterica subsp. enterica]
MFHLQKNAVHDQSRGDDARLPTATQPKTSRGLIAYALSPRIPLIRRTPYASSLRWCWAKTPDYRTLFSNLS